MRLTLVVMLSALMAGMAVPAFAELQNVEVGGSLRIRGNWYGPGAFQLSFDDDDDNVRFVEQRATVNVKADFTDEVTAFVELDSYWNWGDDFRSADSIYDASSFSPGKGGGVIPIGGHVTGFDEFDATTVGLYQGYVEARDIFDFPLMLRIGRQEMQFGSEWLVGNNNTAAFFRGLSFDAIRAAYVGETFRVDAWWAKLAELNGGLIEEDGDVDFYGVYGSFTGIEDFTIDAYWMWVREGDHPLAAPAGNGGLGKFDLHTIGARVAGVWGGLDFEGEGAYQFGDFFEDSFDADFNGFGLNGEVGYTVDVEFQPRVFIGGAWFSGPDDDLDDVGFNRLFSDWEYSEFLANTDLSNVWLVRGGASAQFTEKIEGSVVASYFMVDEDFGRDDSLGFEVGVYGTYNYTEDLYFSAGAAAFFPDDAAEEGARVAGNGLFDIGGFGTDDEIYYLFWETGIKW